MTAARPRRVRLGIVLAVFLAMAMAFSGCLSSCLPASQQLTASVVCPTGTRDAVVVAYWTGNSKGGKSFRSDLYCIDAEGGGHKASFAATYFLLVAYVLVALVLAFFAAGFALRLTRRGGAGAAVLLLAAGLGGLTGCSAGTLSREEFAERYPYGAGPGFTTAHVAGVIAELERRHGGPVQVTHVSLSVTVSSFEVQDPRRPENLDDWTWVNGGFTKPRPETTSRSHPFTDDLFELRTLQPARLPAMIAQATRELALEGGRVDSISVRRTRDGVEVRLSVQGTRQRGSVRFTPDGALLEARVD